MFTHLLRSSSAGSSCPSSPRAAPLLNSAFAFSGSVSSTCSNGKAKQTNDYQRVGNYQRESKTNKQE
eukprot:1192328-Prorocentrum_minimum.AAC.1